MRMSRRTPFNILPARHYLIRYNKCSMKSPFPGMDPYLEPHWLDVHLSLIFLAKVAIQRQLGDDLVARSEERLIVEDTEFKPRSRYPDVRVVEHGDPSSPVQPAGGVAVAEPLIFELSDDPVHQRFIEIRDAASGGRVVTVVEFLSPSNKLPGDGRVQYKRKQNECIDARVNLVEIDLTRAGSRELLVPLQELPPEYRTAFMACVYRATWKRVGRKEVYRIPLRERLPAIRIPLRATDPDIILDLQALIDEAYESGRYDRTTDYNRDLDPPLEPEDSAWADQFLKSAGKR
jgi:hypothetical protein